MWLVIINIISLLFMLTINILANLIPINGYHTAEISDMYPTLFIPAGITFFLIWSIIYVVWICFTYQLLKSWKNQTGLIRTSSVWFVIANILNGLWLLSWHHHMVGISVIIMLALLSSLIILYRKIKSIKKEYPDIYTFCMTAPLSIYLGWISIATIANISAYLVSVKWCCAVFSGVLCTQAALIAGTVIAGLMLVREKDYLFAGVVIWAYLGILIKRFSIVPVYYSIIIMVIIHIIIICSTALYVFKKNRVNTIKTANMKSITH
ncbi:MAG: tryptophan-rich sensory protein [Candidatus Margulisiibacteriota bacterium]